MTKRKLMCEAGIGDKPMTPELSTCLEYMQNRLNANRLRERLSLQDENGAVRGLKSTEFLKNVVTHVNSPFLQLQIEGDIKNSKRALPVHRWSDEHKLVNLMKWKLSPKAYRAEAQMMELPSIRTLSRMLEDIPSIVGLNESILQAIKIAASQLQPEEKFVNLMFDEMAIKTRLTYRCRAAFVNGFADYGDAERLGFIADHALVFMIRGLTTDFKQPVAYYYISSHKGLEPSHRLSKLIRSVIRVRAIHETGLIVKTTVCDQAPTNRGAYEILKSASPNVPDNCTFFLIDDKKVHSMYDTPHIVKCWRNNFMGGWENWVRKSQHKDKPVSKFDYPGDSMTWGEGRERKTAKWLHIIWLYKAQIPHFKKNKNLEESVVFPGSFEKMNVGNAMTVFSKTMTTALRNNACLLAQLFQKDAVAETVTAILQTAEFIEEINELIDFMNGSTPKESQEGPKGDITLTSHHFTKWSKFRKLSKTLKFYDWQGNLKKNIPTTRGLTHNLSALQDVWRSLETEGLTSLNLRRVNQDPLENFFGLTRQESGDCNNPTVEQFDASFKTILITRFSNINIRGTNCRKDGSFMLIDTIQLFHKLRKDGEKEKSDKDIDEPDQEKPGIGINFDNIYNAQGYSPPRIQLYEKCPTIEASNGERHVEVSILNFFFKSKFRMCERCRSSVTAASHNLGMSLHVI